MFIIVSSSFSYIEARRLVWVHCFARCERWKEELLLVSEELRRVGAWYCHHINRAAKAAINASDAIPRGPDGKRFIGGLRSLLWLKHAALLDAYNSLPQLSKEGHDTNFPAVKLEITKRY